MYFIRIRDNLVLVRCFSLRGGSPGQRVLQTQNNSYWRSASPQEQAAYNNTLIATSDPQTSVSNAHKPQVRVRTQPNTVCKIQFLSLVGVFLFDTITITWVDLLLKSIEYFIRYVLYCIASAPRVDPAGYLYAV